MLHSSTSSARSRNHFDGEAQYFRGLEVDGRLKLCGLHHGQIGGFLAIPWNDVSLA